MKEPFILHISTAFHDSKVFHELMVGVTNSMSVAQAVFCGRKIDVHQDIVQQKEYQLISEPVVRKIDSLLFYTRTARQYRTLKQELDVSKINLVHAHFLFTDGAVALKLFKEYGIPYVISVRNTDTNIYFRYFPHLRRLAESIIKHASRVIFISPAHYTKVKGYLSSSTRDILETKVDIIPNGIDRYWLDNLSPPKSLSRASKTSLIFVGNLDRNKNCSRLVRILEKARDASGDDLSLTVVGPPKNDYKAFEEASRGKEWVNYLGPIYDKPRLKDLLSEHDFFIMLSSRETFGLVYIEAMSQGTPVVFTRGQGIDGYFTNESIGVPYHLGRDTGEYLATELRKITDDYLASSTACVEAAKRFSWLRISKKYTALYSEIIQNN